MRDEGLGATLTLALLLGLASVALALATVSGQLDADSALLAVPWLSYALGGTCMVLAMMAGLAGRNPLAAIEIFLLGAVGVALVPLLWLGVVVAVIMVLGAIVTEGL